MAAKTPNLKKPATPTSRPSQPPPEPLPGPSNKPKQVIDPSVSIKIPDERTNSIKNETDLDAHTRLIKTEENLEHVDTTLSRKSRASTTRKLSTTRLSLIPKRSIKKRIWKIFQLCPSFPCCLGMPLEIAVQLLCVADIIYSLLSLILWSILLGMDLFAHKENLKNNTEVFIPPDNSIIKEDPFRTTTTTEAPPWTFRPLTTNSPMYDYVTLDLEIASKNYSKIARITAERHEKIERKCGKEYLLHYLFTYELDKTLNVWHDFLWESIGAELLYIIIAVSLLMCVCCFVEHRGSKLLVMILWWIEWFPIFMEFDAVIMSQSKRLCIIEYAFTGLHGQLFLFFFLLQRFILIKPYQQLVHFCYIRELLVYGYLKDESTQQTDDKNEYAQKYFSEFYALEATRDDGGGNVDAYMAVDTSNAIEFDNLTPAEVGKIQFNIMNTEDDPFSVRNQEIRDMQAGKAQQNIKSVRPM